MASRHEIITELTELCAVLAFCLFVVTLTVLIERRRPPHPTTKKFAKEYHTASGLLARDRLTREYLDSLGLSQERFVEDPYND